MYKTGFKPTNINQEIQAIDRKKLNKTEFNSFFNDSNLNISGTTQSTSTTTGAIVVAGGVGIASNLFVGGNSTISGQERITNTTQSTSSTSGALIVSGGVGIASNLFVGGNTTISGQERITNTTQSTSSTSGALVVSGGVGIGANLSIAGSLGIGTTSAPTGKLHIIQNINTPALILEGTSGGWGSGIRLRNTTASTGREYGIYSSSIGAFVFSDENSSAIRMMINNNGFVGIGAGIPAVPLDIQLNNGSIGTFTFRYLNYAGYDPALVTQSPSTISLRAAGILIATQYNAVSDKRIKANIELINDNLSLQKLRVIEPKKYQYIDKVSKGNVEVFGFIAQEVREKFPEAVTLTTEFVPDIYQLNQYTVISGNVIQLNNITANVVVGDKLKMLDQSGFITGNIQSINESNIIVELEKPISLTGNSELDGNVFLYGKEVNDFHVLNKDYLFTINYAATQEIDKLLDWHINQIDRSIGGNAESVYGKSIQTEIINLKLENQSLKTRIETLENKISQLNL
jgi:enhancing lycopene biosynthesis protein 2